MKITRSLTISVAALTILGCNAPEAPSSKALTGLSCNVENQWLTTRDYDAKIDYANKNIPTDFYMLVYSNSPRYCESLKKQGKVSQAPFQCNSPNEFGWVIHGLWGESKKAYVNNQNNKHPRFCQGDLPALNLETIKPFLCMSPSTKLLQGEWEKHGACDFNTATDYFTKAQTLYESFSTPPKHLSARDALAWMKNNNPALKDKWLHLSKHEFGICFTKRFEVMSCPKRQ